MVLHLCEALKAAGCYNPLLAANAVPWVLENCADAFIEMPRRRKTLDFAQLRWIARLLRQQDIAVLHTHMMGANLHGAIAARLAGRVCVCTVHGRTYDLETRRRLMVHRVIAVLAGALVVVSEDLKQELTRAGIAEKRIQVIENGIPIASISKEEALRTRQELGLEPSQPVAVALAYLRPVKGHSFLLEAFARVCSALPSARLLIIGEGPLRAPLQAQAELLGIQSAVRFLGHRSDAQRFLAAGDLLVNSSISEGTPLSVMEAMALGLPVVATNVGGVPKLVLDGETGLLVPPAEAEALAAALLELMRDAEKRRALGEAGRRRALEQFSIQPAAAKYQALYDKLLEKRASH